MSYPEPDQSSPCHFPTYWWFILIIFNNILPSSPRSFKWPLSVTFPHQNSAWFPPLPSLLDITLLSDSPWFDHPTVTWQLRNEKPTWCHLLFYFTYYALSMFRTLIYSSSGACDCVGELPHRSSCSQFVVCWSFYCGWYLVVFVL